MNKFIGLIIYIMVTRRHRKHKGGSRASSARISSAKSMSLSKTKQSTPTKTNRKASAISTFVPTFMTVLNVVKLYHWQTMQYSVHKATDQLYGDLNEKMDDFVEILLGKTQRSVVLPQAPILHLKTHMSNSDFIPVIETFKNYLISLSSDEVLQRPEHTDLLNVRDEILGILNQFLYLLTLS